MEARFLDGLFPSKARHAFFFYAIDEIGIDKGLVGHIYLGSNLLEVFDYCRIEANGNQSAVLLGIRIFYCISEIVFFFHNGLLLAYALLSREVAFRAEIMRISLSSSR